MRATRHSTSVLSAVGLMYCGFPGTVPIARQCWHSTFKIPYSTLGRFLADGAREIHQICAMLLERFCIEGFGEQISSILSGWDELYNHLLQAAELTHLESATFDVA